MDSLKVPSHWALELEFNLEACPRHKSLGWALTWEWEACGVAVDITGWIIQELLTLVSALEIETETTEALETQETNRKETEARLLKYLHTGGMAAHELDISVIIQPSLAPMGFQHWCGIHAGF